MVTESYMINLRIPKGFVNVINEYSELVGRKITALYFTGFKEEFGGNHRLIGIEKI